MTPGYDPRLDRITGARRGTPTYYHELGHRAIERLSGLCSLQINIFPHILIVSIGLLAFGYPLGARLALGFWLLLSLVNELGAWGFALIYDNRAKKGIKKGEKAEAKRL